MSLSNTQRNAMMSLVSLSATARALVNRVDPMLVNEADINELRRTITSMEAKIGDLAVQLDDALNPDAKFTDEEAHEFLVSFEKVIKALDYRTIVSVYGREYLRPYPKNIRTLICTVLSNVFQQRDFTPLEEWNTVLATNGHLN